MNRYFDRLGSAFEEALARRAGERRRLSGWALAVVSFSVVAVAGAAWLVVRPLRGDTPGTAGTEAPSSTVPIERPAIAGAPLPSEWARAARVEGEASRLSLSGVTAWGDGFVAVGSDADGGASSVGAVLVSPDGVAWEVAARLDGLWLNDVAAGDALLIGAAGRLSGHPDGVPEALVVTSPDGAAWSEHRLPVGPDGAFAEVFAVAVWDGGLLATGSETESDAAGTLARQRPAIWSSTDGVVWERVGAFSWSSEAVVADVSADGPTPVAVGLVGEQAGATRPAAWVLNEGIWREANVPAPVVDGVTGMSAVTFGSAGYVAVGFAPAPGGSSGAVWVSPDGVAWAPVADPAGVLGGGATTAMRMHDVAAVANGYVAVGSDLDRPFLAYRIWTSPDGVAWRRFDLADPGPAWAMSSAHAVAAGEATVAVVGREGDLSGTAGVGVVWVGPPGFLDPSTPVAVGEEASGELPQATVSPGRAVSGTRVWVRGRLGALDGNDGVAVWLVPEVGDPQRLCLTQVLGSVIDCRVVVAEAFPEGITPAVYSVALGTPDAIIEGVTLEILPEGTVAASLLGVYQPYLWPLLQSISVRNDGGDPLDLSGWQIVGTGGTVFPFPEGTTLGPGESFLLDFAYAGGATCPAATSRYAHWCSVIGGDRMYWDDAELLWRGGDVTLVDPSGGEVARWSPP